MNRVNFFLFFLLFVSCFSCKVSDPVQSQEKEPITVPSPTAGPEILMATFQLHKTDSIQLLEAHINVGTLKSTPHLPAYSYDGDLKLTWLSQDGQMCLEEIISNPLLKKVEYINDIDSGKLSAEAVDLEENTFFIRHQWMDCFHAIKIEKKENEEWKLLRILSFSKPPML
ncbi:hypothetical protein [Mongoliitalea daihaiensis]|uniref:hypothetical protein n=1 Tax=Mongoliitalea daihaiensis TaxID=2782006 RepID=UPI001F252F2D|nr:hypothetical protein [Mongoliitalea daihaiensis]UJP64787.1 hypothetical protein IPZ59_18660 [Mongoliitalea daihaiensis]